MIIHNEQSVTSQNAFIVYRVNKISHSNIRNQLTRVSEAYYGFSRLAIISSRIYSINLLIGFRKIIGMNKSHRWVRRLPFPSRYVHNCNNTLGFNVNFTDYDADEIICHVAPCYTFLVHRRHSGRI